MPADERAARCRLTDDLGDIDDATYFIRGVVMIPVIGEVKGFGWGVWARIPAHSFRRYVSTFSDANQADEPPFHGWIATQLRGYPQTLGLPVSVRLTGATTRPLFTVTDSRHPLADTPRPDAWCDACNLAFLAEGEWNVRSEANLGVTLVCGGCYDIIERGNR